jgi:hypothetical protein
MRPRPRSAPVATRLRGTLPSAVALVAAAALLSGCASGPRFQLPPPPTEQLRSQMRSVKAIDGTADPTIVFAGPAEGALAGAGRGARAGFLDTLAFGATAGSAGGYAALGGLAIMALAPVGGLVGAGIGAGRAEPAARVREKAAMVREALVEWNVRERFRDCVAAALREQAPHVVLTASETEPAETILEITVEAAGLLGNTFLVNPPLSFVMTERTRIIRAADGRELYAHALTWRSRLRSLDDWTAQNGAPVQQEGERACRDVAESLVDEVFLLYLPTGGR